MVHAIKTEINGVQELSALLSLDVHVQPSHRNLNMGPVLQTKLFDTLVEDLDASPHNKRIVATILDAINYGKALGAVVSHGIDVPNLNLPNLEVFEFSWTIQQSSDRLVDVSACIPMAHIGANFRRILTEARNDHPPTKKH